MTKFLTLCVNALSFSIKPKVLYYLIGNEHVLNSEAITNIHLDQVCLIYSYNTSNMKIKAVLFYISLFQRLSSHILARIPNLAAINLPAEFLLSTLDLKGNVCIRPKR